MQERHTPDGLVHLGSVRGSIRIIDPTTLSVVATFDAPLTSSHNHEIAIGTLTLAGGDEAITNVALTTIALPGPRPHQRTNACRRP